MHNENHILLGATLDEIYGMAEKLNQPAYRARQICQWIYKKHAVSFEQMTNLSAALREQLAEQYAIGIDSPIDTAYSSDGTSKYLHQVADDAYVESALIPDRDRATLCISTQIGCKRGCRFCMTAKQGFRGDLTSDRILSQYAGNERREHITNIVFMGMGEPMDNPDAVFRALDIFTADYGYAMSPGRLTISTVGILPALKTYIENYRSHLAISLHTPRPDERAALIPAEKKYPIRDLIKLLKKNDWSGQRRLTFEITLFEGINDTVQHAKETAALLKGLYCRVNLIPFNPADELNLRAASRDTMEAYQQELKRHGILTTIRKSKGQDIDAACGLLSTRHLTLTLQGDNHDAD